MTQQKHSAVVVLMEREGTQHEIQRKTEVDRKTVKPSERLPGRWQPKNQIPPWPPAIAQSACEIHREWIESQIRFGRNAMAIPKDLVG